LTFGLVSCNGKTEKSIRINSTTRKVDTISQNQSIDGDSIFIIGDFLFEGQKNMKFEFVKKGGNPKLKTKGDTLYSDNELLILGDWSLLKSQGVYKKFKFKSEFKDFPVDSIYQGNLAKPNFKTNPNAKHFITRIKDGCESLGVNFAGHYTIVEWGCGAACQEMALVNRINGNIIYSQIPFDTLDGHCGLKYKIDSRMLIVNTEALLDYKGYRRDYWRKPVIYLIKDEKFKQIE
jgi:hypothetical protein